MWENLATRLDAEKQAWARQEGGASDLLEGLDLIPETKGELSYQSFMQIQSYFGKVSD